MTERVQFVRLFDRPEVFRATTFQAFWKANDRDSARLGITLKGRLGSVWRARLKRQVREWFRLQRESFGAADLNIVIKVPPEMNWDFVSRLAGQMREWKK
ncbi:MAG: ribonuclease P protein component [Deltaproteobacteria bacterium]|nr:ribonuclease P protein component [Deltaproteobacteria bacterium]